MSEKRKDHKGRILKTGEYWDPKGRRYMFRTTTPDRQRAQDQQ